MSMTHEAEPRETTWKIKAAVFDGRNPRWAGNRTLAVLQRGDENSLILDTGYDMPSVAWRLLMAVAVAVLVTLAVVLKGHPISNFSVDGVAAIFAVYTVMLWLHRQGMKIDLNNSVSEVVIDEQRDRIALLTETGGKKRWVVLSEFRGRFSEVSAAIHDVLREKCRPGEVAEGSWLLLIIMLIVVGLVVAALSLPRIE
jgi:hypothetical protein